MFAPRSAMRRIRAMRLSLRGIAPADLDGVRRLSGGALPAEIETRRVQLIDPLRGQVAMPIGRRHRPVTVEVHHMSRSALTGCTRMASWRAMPSLPDRSMTSML
jgi:hypothetical protein